MCQACASRQLMLEWAKNFAVEVQSAGPAFAAQLHAHSRWLSRPIGSCMHSANMGSAMSIAKHIASSADERWLTASALVSVRLWGYPRCAGLQSFATIALHTSASGRKKPQRGGTNQYMLTKGPCSQPGVTKIPQVQLL